MPTLISFGRNRYALKSRPPESQDRVPKRWPQRINRPLDRLITPIRKTHPEAAAEFLASCFLRIHLFGQSPSRRRSAGLKLPGKAFEEIAGAHPSVVGCRAANLPEPNFRTIRVDLSAPNPCLIECDTPVLAPTASGRRPASWCIHLVQRNSVRGFECKRVFEVRS